ncbi:hypothetical protein COT40_00515, partial [Candidatus Peregrinibacteria bacterium CG08_land_8_20_14_0_20_41_10]
MRSIFGHEKQIAYLEQVIQNNQVKHAYLFTGPESIGKFALAKKFAGALQCPSGYCKTCLICQQVEKEIHPDTVFLRNSGESLKIEEIRVLIQKTSLTFQGRFYLVVIEDIERITEEATNALLKTLEEPATRVVFIFTTASANLILPTLLSRVQQLEFFNMSHVQLKQFLQQQAPERNAVELSKIIQLALGKPGLAIKLLKDPLWEQSRQQLYEETVRFLKEEGLVEKFKYLEELTKESEKIKPFLEMLIYILHNKLLEDLPSYNK